MASSQSTYQLHGKSYAALPIKTEQVGRPRLDPYQRLTSRFYEALFLLKVLGQTRGRHTPSPIDTTGEEACRRRFLRNLSYICDFHKGGSSCTAIGVEDVAVCYNFWVASNEATNIIACFLKATLKSLNDVANTPLERRMACEDVILRRCVSFAAQRVKKDVACLLRALQRCHDMLKKRNTDTDRELSKWLQSVSGQDDHVAWCASAYDSVKSYYMVKLSAEARSEERERRPHEKQGPFAAARHHIGRLAYRIKAHKQLLQDASNLGYLLETCEVCIISPATSIPRPEPDSHTTLHGILNRMLRKDDPERSAIEDTLLRMNHQSRIFQRYMQEFSNCKPTVHAEIQVLEHFANNKLKFVANDRYIACSKPACLSCKLYFQHHPARMVVPGSHEKVWSSWGPPVVAAFHKTNEESIRQRDILIKMIESLRNDAIAQILKTSQPPAWHADSQTGISDVTTSYEIPLQTTSDVWHSSSSESESSGAEPLFNEHATSSPLSPSPSTQTSDNGANKCERLVLPDKDFDEGDEDDEEDGGACIGNLDG